MTQEFLTNVVMILGTWLTAIITYKLTSKNDKAKLLSTQFKEKGIEKQKQLLELWTICAQNGYDEFKLELKEKYSVNNNSNTEIELIKLYMKDILLYASNKTMKLFAIFMQLSYKTKDTKKPMLKTLYLSFRIMASMKYDFTGEKVRALDLIKIKINDLDFKKYFKLICLEIYYSELLCIIRFW